MKALTHAHVFEDFLKLATEQGAIESNLVETAQQFMEQAIDANIEAGYSIVHEYEHEALGRTVVMSKEPTETMYFMRLWFTEGSKSDYLVKVCKLPITAMEKYAKDHGFRSIVHAPNEYNVFRFECINYGGYSCILACNKVHTTSDFMQRLEGDAQHYL